MQDIDVGQLLKETEIFGSDFNENGGKRRSHDLKLKMRELISKLIDERKDKLYIYGYAPLSGIESKALKDFDISEKEWIEGQSTVSFDPRLKKLIQGV